MFLVSSPASDQGWEPGWALEAGERINVPTPAEGDLVAHKDEGASGGETTYEVVRRCFTYAPDGVRIDVYLRPLSAAEPAKGAKVLPFLARPDRS